MNWQTQSFSTLTTDELYRILQLRASVFVVEQNCPYQDMDDKDQKAIHLWASDAEGNVTAYCRLLPAGVSYAEPSIGRVVTAPAVRGTGAGRVLMQQAMTYIRNEWNQPPVRISAQCYLEKFYTSLGFSSVGEPYPEDDIPHIEMLFHP